MMRRLIPLAVALGLLVVLASGVQAQTTPTVSTVAITSSAGSDDTYATGDVITVTVTFSEAVTVSTTDGTPRITLDIGGQPRYAYYSGAGSNTGEIQFEHTVLVGDGDSDGVSVLENSLALDGGTIQATDDPADAALTHSAVAASTSHKVDTEVLLYSNVNQTDRTPLTVSATESVELDLSLPIGHRGAVINEIILDVRTASDTLEVTIEINEGIYTYTGSVSSTGLQTFTLSAPATATRGTLPVISSSYGLEISGSGTGSVELQSAWQQIQDPEGNVGWNLINVDVDVPFIPQMQVRGHAVEIPFANHVDVVSRPANGTAYAAGERIEIRYLFTAEVDIPQDTVVPIWLGNGAEHRREATMWSRMGPTRQDADRVEGFIVAYTVQPEDVDTDGIYIAANALGDNADAAIIRSGYDDVPVDLTIPEYQLGTEHSVEGSRTHSCRDALCSTMVVGEREDGTIKGFSLGWGQGFIGRELFGATTASTFAYGTERRGIWGIRRIGNNLELLINAYFSGIPLSQAAHDRLYVSLDGELFRFQGHSVYGGDRHGLYYRWSDVDLTWAEGDEVQVRLFETAAPSFDAATYTNTEGEMFDVTVTLDEAFLDTTVTVPITVTANGGATDADYILSADELVFAPGDTEKTFTVTVVDDTIDDDDEGITLSFGEEYHLRSGGTNETATITLTDNDHPEVEVEFGASSYTVAEGGSQSFTVTLDADPERTLEIPIVATGQGGADSDDYSGVPTSVTFNATETSKSFTFRATQDTVDDDDESVKLTFGDMPDERVSEGTTDELTFSITDDDDPFVTLMFQQTSYTVAESDDAGTMGVTENQVQVTATLDAVAERDLSIPLTLTHRGGADPTDYDVPLLITFGPDQLSSSITFTASHDTVDDDGERIEIGFGAITDPRVNLGTPTETTVTILDDDDPFVTVRFGASSYNVQEGTERLITVRLNADPERTISIPITATDQGGATSDDYSGVPPSVTFNAGETLTSFTFSATEDASADSGESVLLRFGAMPDARVSSVPPAESTVNIRQTSEQFSLQCNTAVWCADLSFADWSAVDWGWFQLTTEAEDSPLSEDTFTFRGVQYTVHRVRLNAGTYPVLANTWSRERQTESHITLTVRATGSGSPPSPDHYRDWVLHLDGLELPFRKAVARRGGNFVWIDANIQETYNDWTPSKINKIGLQEVAEADQDSDPLATRTPRGLTANAAGDSQVEVRWSSSDFLYPLPNPRSYVVQWKQASASWSTPAQVSETQTHHRSGVHRMTVTGLTPGVVYSFRVYALDSQGNGRVSDEILARAQATTPRLVSNTVNGNTVTLGYSASLNPANRPLTTSFVVLVDGGLAEVTAVQVSGSDVVLTLAQAVTAHSRVQAQYVPPTDHTGTFLQDLAGNYVGNPRDISQDVSLNLTPNSSVQPLTASFTNVPSSHDGSAEFTLNVQFTEKVWISSGLPGDDLLTVTGGRVTSAVRVERLSDLWTITVQPETQEDLTIVLPKRMCEALPFPGPPGTPCGVAGTVSKSLANEPKVTIGGPESAQQISQNSEAQGAPEIQGTAEVGQTLTAVTTAITDQDGLQNVVFSYQWLADGVDIGNATESTYVLTEAEATKVITVRVSFTDDVGHEESLTSAPTAAVTAAVALELQSAAVDGSRLTLTYNRALEANVTIPASAFAVNVNSTARPVLGVAVGQTNVILLLSGAVVAGDSVTVSYTKPTGSDVIKDTGGLEADSFSGQEVSNDTAGAVETNTAATGSPAIEGTAQVGETLTASTSGIDDEDGMDNAVFSYQWLADDVAIDSATESSYTLVAADEGKAIRVRVSFTDDEGNPESLTSAPTSAVAAAPVEEVPPFTASALGVPASHDGSSVFTFELRLSEAPRKGFSYKTLRDHAFTVTGGEVVKARRLEQGKNIRWEIHVRPDGNGTVTVVLPVTTDCNAQGAICTQDGRMLSEQLEISVPGPGG